MRIYKAGIASFVLIASLAACDKGFESLNKDPNAVTGDRFNPAYLLASAQLQTAKNGGETNTGLFYCEGFVQHFASLSNVGIFNFHGDKYVYHKGNNEALWFASYDIVKLLQDLIYNTQEVVEYNNLLQMSRIWRTVVFQRLTDLYGDVPYSEAGLAFYQHIYKPKYDSQKFIYEHMLAELEDATAKLNSDMPLYPSADIVYDGDIQKWKRLGYSMMLRLGMRLSKVEPENAKLWVQKAYNGGVFESNDDNLFIRGTDAEGTIEALSNADSWVLSVSTREGGKISKTFFDFLKNHHDPRLKHTVAVYTNPMDITTKNTDPAIQKGLPNGLDRNTLMADPSYDPDAPGQEHQYSGINRDVYGKLDGPRMFITHGEVALLLAEATVRGWIGGNAAEYYGTGVRSAMKNLSIYDPSALISDAEINEYLAENPFVGTQDLPAALEQINTQYWAATFMNGYEAFANVRRSGYPRLIPVNYPDNETGGLFPRRLRYPENEAVLNTDHYKEAVARQGIDNYITRLWWDKED
jgi:hypothetical protein